MSIIYTVRPCNTGDLLVDHKDEDDISDYIDDFYPRGFRPQNGTVMVRVCKKAPDSNNTRLVNTSDGSGVICKLKKVTVASPSGGVSPSEGEIPQDILEDIKKHMAAQNQTEPEEQTAGRQKRQADGNWTNEDISSGLGVENMTDVTFDAEMMAEEKSQMPDEKNETAAQPEESSEILLSRENLLRKEDSSEDSSEDKTSQNLTRSKPDSLLGLEYNFTADNTNNTRIDLSLEYDDYSEEVRFTCMSCLCSYKHYIKYWI